MLTTHPRRLRGSQSGWEKRGDESFQSQAEKPLGTDSHRTISKRSSECRLPIGHKKCFVIVLLCPIGRLFLSTISKFIKRKKFCHCLFMSFTKREISHFHMVVVQWRQRNLQKSVMHEQSCCFALASYCFFLLSCRRCILNFLLLTIHCDPSETEFSQWMLIASETFFDLSVVPSFLVRKAWWMNRAIAVVYELTKMTREKLFADWAQ